MSDGLLDAAAIRRYLDEVTEELPRGAQSEAAVVAFYAAYPLENRDDFLADHIRTIII